MLLAQRIVPGQQDNQCFDCCVASGSASRGLYRVHQFSKVEMFVVCTPEQSEALLEDLADLEKEMFTELGLHFKILVCPA